MSRRDPHLLVKDMIIAVSRILEYTADMKFAEFSEDQKTIDAVIRNFEIIGEASRQIPHIFQEQNTSIPWRDLSDLRNRLIHEYFGVDLEIVWEIISVELEDLLTNLKR
jgi:uncharacterized protein with HEPN domain